MAVPTLMQVGRAAAVRGSAAHEAAFRPRPLALAAAGRASRLATAPHGVRRAVTKCSASTASAAEKVVTLQPLPLLDMSKEYSHVSPGVCDACITDASVRSAWIDLLLGQLPSHRTNAQRSAESAPAHRKVYGVDQELLKNYWTWEIAYNEFLESIRKDSDFTAATDCTLLYMVEEKERLLRAHSLDDPFEGLKNDEYRVAMAIYPLIAQEMDALTEGGLAPEHYEAMLLLAVECALAGNLFDAGAAAAVANIAFCGKDEDTGMDACDMPNDPLRMNARDVARAHQRIRTKVARPAGGWRYDNFDAVVARARSKPWKRVMLFCDNAGADVMGMLLLARTLVQIGGEGCTAALVANSTPVCQSYLAGIPVDIHHRMLAEEACPMLARAMAALNDVTYAELDMFVKEAAQSDAVLKAQCDAGQILCMPSGQTSTLLDMARMGEELNHWVSAEMEQVNEPNDWLLILDGMGRSLESNWNAGEYMLDGVSVMTCAMVKSQINADRLDAEVYDCVLRLNPPAPSI